MSERIKNLLKHKALFLVFFVYSGFVSAEKIGFVYMEKLIDSSPQISQAKAVITAEFKNQYTIIEENQADLSLLEERITRDGSIMKLEKLAELQERARILERKIRRDKEDLNDAISIRRNQLLNKIQEELRVIVKEYAIAHNYDAILINSILYVSDEMDITQEILTAIKNKNNEN